MLIVVHFIPLLEAEENCTTFVCLYYSIMNQTWDGFIRLRLLDCRSVRSLQHTYYGVT